jgi:PAS domain S-box-containing protein
MSVTSNRPTRARPEKPSASVIYDATTAADADDKRTKKQLLDEISSLRERIAALEAFEPGRKAIESELKGTKRRVQYLLAVSPAIIYTNQASGDFSCTFVSENLTAIMGYSPQEMIADPKCWSDHLHPEDAPRVFDEMRPLIEKGGGTVEYRFRHRDGHYIWIQDTFRLVKDEAGHPLELVGAWADITKRKSAETELSDIRLRLQYLLAISPAIIYTTKASGDFTCTFVSENLCAIMGYSPQEMTTDPKCWPDHLHPDDAKRVFEAMPPLIEKGGGTVEYRFRHRDGHYIWIQDSFRVVNDEAGHPLELVGAWADITESKRTEQAALEANIELRNTKRYLTRLIESSTDAIIATDKEGKIVLFNEGAETLLGYRAAEVIGRHTSGLYENEDVARDVLREMRKRGGTVAGFDSVLKAKNGKNIPVLISASVLFGEHGEEVGTVGFATDLTIRKREEEELRKAHDELEKRVEERTTELKSARERLQYLMTVTPAIVYTNQASDYTCTFVSENVSRIMGFSAWEMLEDKDFWGRCGSTPRTPRACSARWDLWWRSAAARWSTASGTVTDIISGSRTRSG